MNILIYIVLLILWLENSLCIEFRKRFTLQANSYLELQNGFINDVEINFSSGTIQAGFEISLPIDLNPSSTINNSAMFDVFIFSNKDVEGILCYKRAIINGDFSAKCKFEENHQKLNKTIINENLFQFQNDLLALETMKYTYIIDNTKYPVDGAYIGQDLIIDSRYHIEVESAMSYFIRTIGVAVALGVILIIFVVGLLYLMIKYKEVKKKNKEEMLDLNQSFMGGKKQMIRMSSKERNESYEESKGESSVNNSLNIRKFPV